MTNDFRARLRRESESLINDYVYGEIAKAMIQLLDEIELLQKKQSISMLIHSAHQNAINKGWYEDPRTFGELIALMHSELSEALEDYRAGRAINEIYYKGEKPCGVPIELADVLIRVFDLCGYYGIDLEGAVKKKMHYNATRERRHGGKRL